MRPFTRLARWGWRAAGLQRLSLLRERAALGLRLGQSRLSAARSGRLRGRVVRLASSLRRSRDVQLCLLLSSYIILCGSATSACVQLARGRAAAAQGSSILMEWARYWFDGRSQRFGPCRSSLALPVTRLARWGWRAAGAQRLSRSGMSAAGGMRLSRWRLSAARSSPVRGLVAHLVNSPRTRRGDFRRPRRKQTSCWPNSRLGF